MGQSSKLQRAQRLQQAGLEGSMSRGEADADDARERRGAQRELDFIQRFDPDQFQRDSEGRVALRLNEPNPPKVIELVHWLQGETGGGTGAPIRDVGYTFGPSLEDGTDEAFAKWAFPRDVDKTQPVKLRLRAAQIGTTSGSIIVDLEVYPYVPGDNVITDDGSPSTTLQATASVGTTSGAAHTLEFTLEPGKVFQRDALLVFFRATRDDTVATDLALIAMELEYTPLYYHTHE